MKTSVETLKKLQHKKYRLEHGCFIAEGAHLVQELLAAATHNPALLQAQLYCTPDYAGVRGGLECHELSAAQMLKVSDTKTPQGVLAVVPIKALTKHERVFGRERVFYLHEIQDPGNLGSILRSLAWFGMSRCILSPASVDPFNAKVVRATMGAIFHVPIETELSLEAVHSRYPRLACLDMKGTPVADRSFADFDAYVFGNEARGLPPVLQARAFTIPGSGKIESLNLATAVNICAYELAKEPPAH